MGPPPMIRPEPRRAPRPLRAAPAGPERPAGLVSTEASLDGRGFTAAAALWLFVVALARPVSGGWGTAQEALCYWLPSLTDPYAHSSWTEPIAYVYSPAFLQLLGPIRWLPWPAFVGVWTAILIAAVWLLTGPRWFLLGLGLAAMEIGGGNISLLLAIAVVLGFRWPAAWAFVLLTKVTPGVGLLWFAVRGEWRHLGLALLATAVVVAASAVAMPGAWLEWIEVLVRNAGRSGTWAAVPIPLALRLPGAVLLVVWGARTDRSWTVPVASLLALPALWYGSFAMLLAVLPLVDRSAAATSPVGRWIAGRGVLGGPLGVRIRAALGSGAPTRLA
ncbi:MAG TPA: glycosyltransferase 87 family protein [Candidatus Binatia bacterium]|nr:glycosyltransferase 87 family protein [Candidatus Binatia bacterium]